MSSEKIMKNHQLIMKKYMKFKRINGLSKLNENRILNNIIETNIFN